MHRDERSGARLESTSWVIDARWYYATLAFFLGVIARDDAGNNQTLIILIVGLVVVLSCNVFFYLYLRKAGQLSISDERVHAINMAQIAIDLTFFFVVMVCTGGGIDTISHSFFFVPIVVSVMIFGARGALSVAVASGLLVFLSTLLHLGILTQVLYVHSPVVLTHEMTVTLLQAGIIFLLYLMTGFFSGYLSRMLHARDVLLFDQIAREENHVGRLEELTKAFDQSAKLLVRRDLELTSANDKLVQLDKMKSEIISVVAHQLRTPLSAIKWTLKILLDKDAGGLTTQQEELLGKGFESNERMITLINDMLAVDRLESGKLKYNFVPVQFEDIVQEMIKNLLPLATEKNIRIEFSSPKELLPKIRVDIDKIRDVLQNLIDNAIKYTRTDGVIEIGVADENEELHFWVKDNGIGIPDDEKDKIFSRFFRATNATHTATDGSGLGLFIAQSIAKRHGGKMWFESKVDEGTTFHVVLPLS